jgi:predicted ester cyclase
MTGIIPPAEAAARCAIERLHAAVNAHDAEAVAALCAEGIVWNDPAAGRPLHGREAVRRFHRDVMFRALPDVHLEVAEGPYLSADGSHIALRLRISGTMEGPLDPPGFGPTGANLEFETAEFSHFQDGLLIHHRVVLDMLEIARQIGAAPKAGAPLDRMNIAFQRIAAWRLRHSGRRAARQKLDQCRGGS